MKAPTQTQWPTPTGERARNHQALKLAHVLKNYLPSMEALEQAGDMLSRQHALIVRMREALMSAYDHIEMGKLRRSHCNDADRIVRALNETRAYLEQKP